MPSKSKSQQRLMGMVHAYNKGELNTSDLSKSLVDKIKSISKSMTDKEVEKFASTKHKNKPEKVDEVFPESWQYNPNELKYDKISVMNGRKFIKQIEKKEAQKMVRNKNAFIISDSTVQIRKLRKMKENTMNKKNSLIEYFYNKEDVKIIKEGLFDKESESVPIPPEIKNKAIRTIRGYNLIGKNIYRDGNLVDIAEGLYEIAEFAYKHTSEETDNWFDAITVKRNMDELKNLAKEFVGVAKEMQTGQDRLNALYEDMGNILNRYYKIDTIYEISKPVHSNYLKEGDRVKLNINEVRRYNSTPSYIRKVKEEMVKGRGTVKIYELKNNTAIVGGGDINLFEVEVPINSLDKIKFDEEKMEKYVKNDKFLNIKYQTGESLESLFNTYIVGDDIHEKKYSEVE